jgi:hypothetical protein
MIAVSTWVMTAASLPEFGGVIDLASLGHNHSMLFGNVAGILSGGAIAIIGSLAANKTFDWNDLKEKITLVEIQADAIKAEEDEATLKKAFQFSLKGGGIMTLVLIIAWPMPLIASGYVFDLGSYSVWVAISVIWVSVASFFIIFLPIIEARKGIAKIFTGSKAEGA